MLIFWEAMLKTSYLFLHIMHKVKTQQFGDLFVKNMFIIYFYMVIIIKKTYKVKKIINKFPKISGKIGINFWKFSTGNFQTHNPRQH